MFTYPTSVPDFLKSAKETFITEITYLTKFDIRLKEFYQNLPLIALDGFETCLLISCIVFLYFFRKLVKNIVIEVNYFNLEYFTIHSIFKIFI